jgi:uncharacterized repeat protein (TIGR03803 family)
MMRHRLKGLAMFLRSVRFCSLLTLGVFTASGVRAAQFEVLHTFAGGVTDGEYPAGGFVSDGSGGFYGTTQGGGASDLGVVFHLAANGPETLLHSFAGGGDGAYPNSLVPGRDGSLYGTTEHGGNAGCGGTGCGTVFKISPDGSESVLHTFQSGGEDGAFPLGGLLDRHGNLFGTTNAGGIDNCTDFGTTGCGTVFELTHTGKFKLLYRFTGEDDGYGPAIAPILDRAGNLYGTAEFGGTGGLGVVFKLTPDGDETVVHAFVIAEGATPGALVMDNSGNFYGTANVGGPQGAQGTVFKIAPDGTETTLHAFGASGDGDYPLAVLLRDKNGNLIGATPYGGGGTGCGGGGCGVLYKIAPDGTETIPHVFSDNRLTKDGGIPTLGLLLKDSALYGMTDAGGANDKGTVFRVKSKSE